MASHEIRVRELAYFLWEAGGQREGRDQQFWLMAERSVVQDIRAGLAPRRPKWMGNLTMPFC